MDNYSKRKHIPMTSIIANFISQGVDGDIFDPDWSEKRAKANREYIADEDCPAFCQINKPGKEHEKIYKCVWWREGKSPDIKKLAEDRLSALNLCEGCDRTGRLEKEWQAILTKVNKGFTGEFTYCTKGGELNEETKKVRCPIQTDGKGRYKWIAMDNCFTIHKGDKCPMLKTLPSRPIKKTGIRRRIK